VTLARHETVIGILGLVFIVGTLVPPALSIWLGTKVGVVAAVLWGLVGVVFMGAGGDLGIAVTVALVVFLAPALIGVGAIAAVRRGGH
jgi:hypothetical protein